MKKYNAFVKKKIIKLKGKSLDAFCLIFV